MGRIHTHDVAFGLRVQHELDVITHEASQQPRRARDQLTHVDDARRAHLASRQRQELAREARATAGGARDLAQQVFSMPVGGKWPFNKWTLPWITSR